MIRFWPGAAAALVVFQAALASAQIQLVPETIPRWDAGVQIAWTSHDSGLTDVSARRYNAPAVTGSAGILLMRHLKLAFGATYAGEAQTYATSFRTVPGIAQPVYTFSEHRFQATTFSSSIGYQFFENRWVHPTIAAGVQVARETHHIKTEGPYTIGLPPVSLSTARETHVRPFVSAGAKFYMAERAFIRTNVDFTLTPLDAGRVTWATGVGFDF